MPDVFAQRLDRFRRGYRLTYTALAELMGVSRNGAYNYCLGNRTPSIEVLTTLCRSVDVSADWFLGLTGEYTDYDLGGK